MGWNILVELQNLSCISDHQFCSNFFSSPTQLLASLSPFGKLPHACGNPQHVGIALSPRKAKPQLFDLRAPKTPKHLKPRESGNSSELCKKALSRGRRVVFARANEQKGREDSAQQCAKGGNPEKEIQDWCSATIVPPSVMITREVSAEERKR